MSLYHAEQALACHVLKNVSGTAARLYQYLANAQRLAGLHGRLWIAPRASTMAADLGRHVRTIRRALAQLRQAGALVVQTRFHWSRNRQWRQISNRIRVITTTTAALMQAETIKKRAVNLFKYRADIAVTPRTDELRTQASRLWKTSPLYLSLMSSGLNKRARTEE